MNEINEFAPDHITAAGIEIPAGYSVSYTGRTVYVLYTLDGDKFRVAISGVCGDIFTAAMRAATKGDTVQVDGDGLMTVLGTAELIERREEQPREANPDKQAHGAVPEKWFIGQCLQGKSWKILFDGDAGKTRVIFPRKPSGAVLEAVKAAGFYWSPSMKSWNKGLNFKAYRAAEKLHTALAGLTA